MSGSWWWIVIGFALMIAELFVPAFVMIFLGIAAVITGVAMLFGLPPDNGLPYILFSVVAIGSLVLFRQRLRERLGVRGATIDDGVADEDFIGRFGVVISGFDTANANRGIVQFRGTQWNATSTAGPFAAEQRVVITGRDGALLQVSATEN